MYLKQSFVCIKAFIIISFRQFTALIEFSPVLSPKAHKPNTCNCSSWPNKKQQNPRRSIEKISTSDLSTYLLQDIRRFWSDFGTFLHSFQTSMTTNRDIEWRKDFNTKNWNKYLSWANTDIEWKNLSGGKSSIPEARINFKNPNPIILATWWQYSS